MKAKPLTARQARSRLREAARDYLLPTIRGWATFERAITAYGRACRAEGRRGKR